MGDAKVKKLLKNAKDAGIKDIMPAVKHRPCMPLADFVMLKAPSPEERTEGGILIPEMHREAMMARRQQGMRVLALGPDVKSKEALRVGTEVIICTVQERGPNGTVVANLVGEPGDTAIWAGGTPEQVILVREKLVVAVLGRGDDEMDS